MEFLSSIIIGLLSALIGSYLAFWKFKKEKLWDERKAIYKEVIVAFEELGSWAEDRRASLCCESTINVDFNYSESLRTISKWSAIGSLFLSSGFQSSLNEAYEKIEKLNFQAHEDAMSESDNPERSADVSRDAAVSMKKIICEYLPKLISEAREETPRKNLF